MDNQDLKYIKKHYGENFAHLCRELFPTILETPGLLQKVITDHFAPSRSLADDISESLEIRDAFKSFVFSQIDVEKESSQEKIIKNPEDLLKKAGYILYPECKTEEDVQAFKKYYEPGEALCTFNGGRLSYCRVWFAVKENVDDIKREN